MTEQNFIDNWHEECFKDGVLTIGADVKYIPDKVFENNLEIEHIVFTEDSNVQEIGGTAFRGCKNLKSIENMNAHYRWDEDFIDENTGELYTIERQWSINLSPKIIEGCDSLELFSVRLADGTMEKALFQGASNLLVYSVAVEHAVTRDGEYLQSLSEQYAPCVLPGDEEAFLKGEIAGRKFDFEKSPCDGATIKYQYNNGNIIRIEDGVLVYVYSHIDEITEYRFPEWVKEFAPTALENYKAKRVVIPAHVTFEGIHAKWVEEIVFPHKLTHVSEEMFSGCSSLKHIDIPETVEYIERGAFYDCSSLERIVIPEKVRFIGERECIYPEEGAFANCTSLQEVIVNSPIIHTIGSICFWNCVNLKKVYFVPSMNETEICDDSSSQAFDKNELLVIHELAFYGCTSLVEITLGTTEWKLRESAFDGCESLHTINNVDDNYELFSTCLCYKGKLHSVLNVKTLKLPHGSKALYTPNPRLTSYMTDVYVPESVSFDEEITCEGIMGELMDYSSAHFRSIFVPLGTKHKYEQIFNGANIEEADYEIDEELK